MSHLGRSFVSVIGSRWLRAAQHGRRDLSGSGRPTAAQPAQAPSFGYRPALDGIRAVAVVSVILMHAFGTPRGGFLGVDLFFVLSGFLITSLLLEEWKRAGQISLRAFYRRRALRLLPALVVVVATYLATSVAVLAAHHLLAWDTFRPGLVGAIGGMFYFSNVLQAWRMLSPEGIRHLWSLAAEEQFYVLWPPALLLLLKLRVSRRWMCRLLLAAICLVVLHRLQLTLAGAGQHRLYFAPDTTADAILIGCLLGVWSSSDRRPRLMNMARRGTIAALGAWAVILWMIFFTSGAIQRSLYAGELTLFAAAGAVVVLVAASNQTFLSRVLSVRPLVFTGRISYGLYLWHPVLLAGIGFRPLVGIPLTFVAASASYRYVELPFLRRKRSPPAPQPVLIAAAASQVAAG